MDHPSAADLAIREPCATEMSRALSLFQHLQPSRDSWLLVGVRSVPIQRFVAASATWKRGQCAQFRIVWRPGVSPGLIAAPFISRIEEAARAEETTFLEYADLLADASELCRLLGEQGFQCRRSERFFEVNTLQAQQRVSELAARYIDRVPKSWRVESIRQHAPDEVASLVSSHGLMPDSDLQRNWNALLPGGFDLDLSGILFDDVRPIGAMLLRRGADAYVIDVRVVEVEDPRLRALGNICLFHHAALNGDARGPIQSLQFRAGEFEHRETANLAMRMGGRELPPRRIMAKRL